jgi:hypothetical protein
MDILLSIKDLRRLSSSGVHKFLLFFGTAVISPSPSSRELLVDPLTFRHVPSRDGAPGVMGAAGASLVVGLVPQLAADRCRKRRLEPQQAADLR